MDRDLLYRYQLESNNIENILGATSEQVDALEKFVNLEQPTVDDLVAYVEAVQPGAELRDKPWVKGVRVGSYIAPLSGPYIRAALESLLQDTIMMDPYETHIEYQKLHPFTDGNGRSGRALFLWHMRRYGRLGEIRNFGFLRLFYYLTLENS